MHAKNIEIPDLCIAESKIYICIHRYYLVYY